MSQNDELIAIGTMAQMNATTRKALMTYEKKGILIPHYQNGNRYYHLSQCSTLDMIQQLQALGASLDEIKAIYDSHDTEVLRSFLEQKRIENEETLLNARLAQHHIQSMLMHMEEDVDYGTPHIEWVDEKRVVFFDVNHYDFVENPGDMTQWEHSLRAIKEELLQKGLPLAMFHNVACVIGRESLMNAPFECVGGYIHDTENLCEDAVVLDAGYCATIALANIVDPRRRRHMEFVWLDRLVALARAQRCTFRADYYCEILAETPAFSFEARDMAIKLFLPIEFPLGMAPEEFSFDL